MPLPRVIFSLADRYIIEALPDSIINAIAMTCQQRTIKFRSKMMLYNLEYSSLN